MKIVNPATGALIREVNEDTQSPDGGTIGKKFDRARSAQGGWARRPIEERIACLRRFHDLIEKNEPELARTLTEEVGKPLQESLNELRGARTRIRFFLDKSAATLNPSTQRIDGNTEEVLSFDPLGVIANISAWNYPWLVGVNVFVPALIAGNAVLYKPSEFATLTGLHIERLLQEAGIPPEVFALVIGGGAAGESLLDLPLDGYFFTGSYRTGKHIAERVAGKLVPVGLELGGKDPLYVADDVADLEKTAAAVAEGCFYNNGQSCCAVERVYVHEKIHDRFLQALEREARKLRVGDPFQAETQQGSLTRPAQVEFLEGQIADAVEKGARILCGGKRLARTGGTPDAPAGSFFEPTVVAGVNHRMRIMTEESFGPIIGVMPVKDDEEAIRLMNDCEYGLTASVYSSNLNRAKEILSRVDSGTSYVNCCDRVSPYLPWAGRKHSGLGATLSYLGILAFTKPRAWHLRS